MITLETVLQLPDLSNKRVIHITVAHKPPDVISPRICKHHSYGKGAEPPSPQAGEGKSRGTVGTERIPLPHNGLHAAQSSKPPSLYLSLAGPFASQTLETFLVADTGSKTGWPRWP